jgi:hypothetical protein
MLRRKPKAGKRIEAGFLKLPDVEIGIIFPPRKFAKEYEKPVFSWLFRF